MTLESELPENADLADVAEQQEELVPPATDDEVPSPDQDDVPFEANEADVAEQRSEVPDSPDDDERFEP